MVLPADPEDMNAQRRRNRPVRSRSSCRFVLTCAAGFEGVVARALATDFDEIQVVEDVGGMLIVEGRARPVTVKALANAGYLSGAHQVILEMSARPGSTNRVVERFAASLGRGEGVRPAKASRSFRIRVIEAGQPVGIARPARSKLERAWQDHAGMRLVRDGGDSEVWVYLRREDRRAWLLHRLDDPRRRRSERGALKPEVAGAFVRVAPISGSDVFLDPFAGSGAIPAARNRYPHQRIIATDSSPEAVAGLRSRARHGDFGDHSTVECVAAGEVIPAVTAPASVDVAVLDPPWGLFRRDLDPADLGELYRCTVSMLHEALRPGGHAVVLVADADLALGSIPDAQLAVAEQISVLVSGKKASVIHLRRSPEPA
jgi:23S rRNA G2445 N2-methylase RlmL